MSDAANMSHADLRAAVMKISRPALIGRGVATMSNAELRAAVMTNRRPRLAPRSRVAQPEFLRVCCGQACHRWVAVCEDITCTGFMTKAGAAHCAARDAWAKRLGHGVSIAELNLVDLGGNAFSAYLRLRRVAS